MKRWALYILQCSDGSLYTGVTTDLPRRLRQHNQGRASKYTRSRRPVKALYLHAGLDHSGALKEELRIKALSRPEKMKLATQQEKG
jgi:putative endonuclease